MSDSRESVTGQCIAEFLGTGLFMFFGTSVLCAAKLAGASFGLWEICIVWGLGIALAVYLTAGISGAHLNPAVTIALWMFARFEAKKVAPYILAQMAGAFCGAALTYLLYHNLFADYEQAHQMVRGSQDSLYLASIFSTYPAASISVWLAALVEIVITSMLIGLIMALTDDGNGVPKGPLAPLRYRAPSPRRQSRRGDGESSAILIDPTRPHSASATHCGGVLHKRPFSARVTCSSSPQAPHPILSRASYS